MLRRRQTLSSFVLALALGVGALSGCGIPVPLPRPAAPAGDGNAGAGAGGAPPVQLEAQVGPRADEPPGLYGDQGGEEVLPADPTIPDTLMRARAGDTFYRLSNARLGQGRFGRPSLSVEYEALKVGQHNGVTVVIHGDDGRRQQVPYWGPLRTHGSIDLEAWFGFPGNRAFPESFEVYLTRGEPRYGAKAPTFKVSTSVTVGNMPRLTRPRNWTKEEIDRLAKPPPNHTSPNAHPDVGRDTAFAGNGAGGSSWRFVEPGGLLLGLEYRGGEWDKEKCLGALVPVFNREQEASIANTRVLAREGYAVGGVKVQAQRYVDAVQILFMRVKPDGKLDPADSYTSEWLGHPSDVPPKTLAGDGTRVIGIHNRAGAVLDGLALVLDPGGKP